MASAAAVGANLGYESPVNDIGDDEGRPGEITSAIGRKEDGIDAGEYAEEDEDIRAISRRKAIANGDLGGEDAGVADEDLFGDEEDDEGAEKAAPRQLDDEELDSGDDISRTDRVGDDAAPAMQTQEQDVEPSQSLVSDIALPRQPLPEPSDGEMYLLKMPNFMAVEPRVWTLEGYQPPTTDHHVNVGKAPSASFSAFNTAMTTLRWRHSPSDSKKLQSNARILRWSDGSLTVQLASQPTVQYDIDGNSLAPPQRNALKPTPVSITAPSTKGGRQGDGTIAGEKYDASKDASTYLVVPHMNSDTLRITHKITAGLSMKQPEDVQDAAIERLQAALATAANATRVQGVGNRADALVLTEEDPEEQRRIAERTQKEKARADKKREAAIQRENERSNRTLGRSGLTSSRGGLSAGMLEDDEGGMGTSRPRKSAGAAKGRRTQRRNSIYSDDEDFGRKHFVSKEDEYDTGDDFLAKSDEEEEVSEDEDPDDGIVEERRERTPKRDRAPAGRDGEDEDADGEVDEEAVAAPKTKRRRVVDEDEDEE
ncbi:hypothetical protein LTR53_010138 [Teratosphaeriaceae sp. CCFEE 6253]|nr:hypothetical protein LTR53_010138 [Teratosphaeriaceae sp. CCFEE 6253]